MPRRRILVVDDNEQMRKLARVILVAEHYDVETVASAEEARLAVARRVPDLILMDVQMPGTDGLALTRELKANSEYRSIVIIAFTASAMKGDDRRALEAGCDAYLAKPAEIATLRRTIAEQLSRPRGTAESR